MVRIDQQHCLHPYSSPSKPGVSVPVVGAEGVRLLLADGRELIDGMASWWCVIHGYNHPKLNQALQDQISKMSHVMFGGITHPQALTLAKKLVDITPVKLQKVFFSDSGSVAVEVAIKMAIQYWAALGKCNKNRMLTVRNGYHGDTFGAMSVCDPVTGMHHLFSDIVVKQYFADAPKCRYDSVWNEADIKNFKDILEKNYEKIAAVILEPIVQGAGGMRFYAPEYLRQIRQLCDEYDVLLIVDEIATGFGRTGKLFACEHAGVTPDIICLGKAITGGYMSFAATMTTNKVCDGIGRKNGVFMHGPTFMANPLACSVANASIDLLLTYNLQQMIGEIENGLEEGLAPCRDMPGVCDVRVLGAIGVVEMKNSVDLPKIQEEFVRRGVWVRPFGRLIYLMPPFVITRSELEFLTKQVVEVVSSLASSSSLNRQ
nr:adenosylmethionine--8-amino-7-oxononanoate transaminase [Desulfobulbaceae bacterium]